MQSAVSFDYFYGGESEQFSYYRIPRLLVTGAQFKFLSTDAKLLYGLMLDRMGLSLKNQWYDAVGRVFIYYPLEEIMEALNCGHNKAVRLLAELDKNSGIGLIERVKQGQGKPTIIYVKRFTSRKLPVISSADDFRLPESGSPDFPKAEVKTSHNQKSRLPESGSADFPNQEVLLYSKNQTDNSYLYPSIHQSEEPIDAMDRNRCRTLVKENIGYVQNPTVSQFGTADHWKARGRSVRDIEKNNGIQIFAKGSFSKGYTISNAYDISQTTGRDVVNRTIPVNSNEMDTALTTAMNYSPVPIVMDQELTVPAYYDRRNLELAINPSAEKAEAFPYIVAEVAHAKLHNKGKNLYYDRKECELDAQSVAYLVCKRFGIKCDMPDASFVTDLYAGYTAPQIRLALSSIQEMSKNMGGSIEKNIAPQTKGRASMYRPTR